MRTKELGSRGLQASELGLGCMGMSDFYGSHNDQESLKTLDRAAELGVTFWDTADMYGPFTNEELVGKALKGRRDKITLATKFGFVRDPNNPQFRGVNGKPEYVPSACEASLKRLDIDTIDLYYLHRVDPATPMLGRGFLTGQIKKYDDLEPGDFRRNSPRFQGENFQKNLDLVDQIGHLTKQKGSTTSQLALAWVMAQGDHIFPIPGTKRIAYLEENAGAADIHFTPQELKEIDAISPKNVAAGLRYTEAGLKMVNQ